MEMPGFTAAESKGVQTVGTVKGGRNGAQAVISDFKKKLDSLSAAGQPAIMVQPQNTTPEDLSMATNAAAQELPQGVVGILEGFGLLDGQTDMGAASAETAQTAAVSVQTPTAAVEQAQTSGQFARMLNQEQPGETAVDMPQQPNADAGKYSGSLESTNSTAVGAESATGGAAAAIWQLKSKLADTAPTVVAASQATVSDASPAVQTTVAQAVTPSVATAAQPGAQTTNEEAQAVKSDMPQMAATELESGVHEKAQEPPTPDASAPAAPLNVDATVARAPQADGAVKADGAQSGDAPAESAFVKDNVIRIVDKASASVREGRYEFDVDLKPDFLGKVSIRLTMQDGEVRMHVRADDPTVRGMFSDQASALTSALKEKGIAISMVDVSYQDPTAAGREASAQTGNSGGQRREGQAGWTADRYAGSDIGDMFETLTPVSELLGGSSVEYLA
jgi:flagellar hook-length control protein FliK